MEPQPLDSALDRAERLRRFKLSYERLSEEQRAELQQEFTAWEKATLLDGLSDFNEG